MIAQKLRADELDAFASRVAHDVRGPLTPVAFALQMLERDFADDAKRRSLIERGIRSLGSVNTAGRRPSRLLPAPPRSPWAMPAPPWMPRSPGPSRISRRRRRRPAYSVVVEEAAGLRHRVLAGRLVEHRDEPRVECDQAHAAGSHRAGGAHSGRGQSGARVRRGGRHGRRRARADARAHLRAVRSSERAPAGAGTGARNRPSSRAGTRRAGRRAIQRGRGGRFLVRDARTGRGGSVRPQRPLDHHSSPGDPPAILCMALALHAPRVGGEERNGARPRFVGARPVIASQTVPCRVAVREASRDSGTASHRSPAPHRVALRGSLSPDRAQGVTNGSIRAKTHPATAQV